MSDQSPVLVDDKEIVGLNEPFFEYELFVHVKELDVQNLDHSIVIWD